MCGDCHFVGRTRESVPVLLMRFGLLLVTMVGAAALLAGPAQAQVNFNETLTDSGNTGTTSIISGDFNNDGILDLVTVNFSSLSFYKGLGGGQYAVAVNQSLAQNLGQVFAADFNQDGKLDLAIAGISYGTAGVVTILLGNGDGTFKQNCAPPAANKLSVNICAPKSGEAVASKFTFKAAGNSFNGIAKRMELWIDGKKVAQNLEDQLKATISLSAGKHTASFVVVDSFDETSSSSVTFTAN
jgi:hypothetical protein